MDLQIHSFLISIANPYKCTYMVCSGKSRKIQQPLTAKRYGKVHVYSWHQRIKLIHIRGRGILIESKGKTRTNDPLFIDTNKAKLCCCHHQNIQSCYMNVVLFFVVVFVWGVCVWEGGRGCRGHHCKITLLKCKLFSWLLKQNVSIAAT